MLSRKRPTPEEEQLEALYQRAELIRRRSHELIRETELLVAQIAAQTESVENQPGPVARKPR